MAGKLPLPFRPVILSNVEPSTGATPLRHPPNPGAAPFPPVAFPMTSAVLPPPARPATDEAPPSFEATFRQAVEFQSKGRTRDAIFWYQRALAARPGAAEAWNNLGALFLDLGRREDARRHFETALGLRPRYARPHVGIGTLLQADGFHREAAEHFRAALAIDPSLHNVRFNLGLMLQFIGDLTEASDCLRAAQDALANQPQVLSQYLLCLNYRADMTGEAMLEEHRRFGARHPLSTAPRHGNVMDPDRPLRIGWLAVDYRQHLGSYFLEPVLRHADRARYPVHAYSALPPEAGDGHTARFRALADGWTSVHGMSDAEIDARIRADGIDVLVDLAGHSGLNRLSALAAKPAPVQITWLGYANTTGLPAMDARLVDAVTDPEGVADAHTSERLIRLPVPFLCFAPPIDAPPVEPPPSRSNGYVTFGSLNTLAKHTPEVFALWARILVTVPNARLLLKDRSFGHAQARDRLTALFTRFGVAADRLTLLDWTADRNDHLTRYRQIDIALDPFPYNGTITSCDALWMGVPLLTLIGRRHAARVGASLLTAVGLGELVALDEDDCVARAAALANDPERLAALRAGMRDRLLASPLCDAKRFTRNLEETYRDLWRGWCAGNGG